MGFEEEKLNVLSEIIVLARQSILQQIATTRGYVWLWVVTGFDLV